MTIILKNKDTLIYKNFFFKCCIGKGGLTSNKFEGDYKTPKGTFSMGNLYYRKDRNTKPATKLKCISLKRKMGWCNDTNNKRYYNKLFYIKKKIKHEKLFRNDYKYDYFLPIKYNMKNKKLGKGSAIFIHLTKNFKPTAGCVAIEKKDFLILLKLLNKKTKIKII
tara:strand:+ start:617 stop:1111 length:495 start_codon:yes stop_codon:yes gene_type:complete